MPAPAPNFNDIEVLARTIWGEARNQGPDGMRAVAETIANRVHDPRWPSTFSEVCCQPKQFSCWNDGDPNLAKLANVTLDDPQFESAVSIAVDTIMKSNPKEILVNGANHYLTQTLFDKGRPGWADPAKVVARIGSHVFLKL